MTAGEVKKILQRIGLRPQQAAGQNFLLDERVAESMVAAADVQADDVVLEIGPGLGILTAALLQTGAHVVAVELDQRLFNYLRRRWSGEKRLRLVNGDIFRLNLGQELGTTPYKLVANLPYSGTSLVFRNFLTLPPRPTSLTVMVQRDVAKRLTAQPGQMSLLALTTQYYCRPSILFDVTPNQFFPIPKVFSTVIHCDELQPVRPDVDAVVFRIIRAGFSARRKQLHKNLTSSLRLDHGRVTAAIEKTRLAPTVRAQELSLENWLTLAKVLG